MHQSDMHPSRPHCGRLYSLAALAALCTTLAFTGQASAQDDSCGAITFADGSITTERVLPAETPLSEDTTKCLSVLAKEVAERRYIRSLTVVVRLPDEQRKGGEGLVIANAMRDALSAAGAPKRKLSSVAPAVSHGQNAGVQLVYSERRSTRVVARIEVSQGTVTVGPLQTSMEAAVVGTDLHTHEYVKTEAESLAILKLFDGSSLYIKPSSLVRVGPIDLTADYQRQVRIELLSGSVDTVAAASKPGSIFNVVTRAAVAGVRGTYFRLVVQADGTTRIEALEGHIDFGDDAKGNVAVAAGQGSRASEGAAPESPRALLVPSPQLQPIQGTFASAPALTWKDVPGASGYMVEVARNAQFTRGVVWQTAMTANLEPNTPSEGRWFWRVSAIDADGFVGLPSKIYSFVVDSTTAP